MKSIRLSILLLLLLAASHAGLRAQSTKAWVTEKDLEHPDVEVDVYLQSDLGGPYTPTLPVSSKGNVYQLWALGTAWDKNEYLLDTKTITAYSPSASFAIETGDPYYRGDLNSPNFVRRTRADEPYTMTVTISGVVEDPAAAAEEKSVEVDALGMDYYTDTYSGLAVPDDPDTPTINEERPAKAAYSLDNDVLTGNNTWKYGFDTPLYPVLDSPADKTKSVGEIKFTVTRYAADGIPATIIAEPKIEVWPVASASFVGVVENQVFIDAIPELVFTYKDLYPDSKTYVQIYSGEGKTGTQGTIVETTERKYGSHYNPSLTDHATVPQNVSIAVSGLSSYTPKDGFYTMEIITETPFHNRAQILLKRVTFEVDRVISSRGKLSTAEGSP